MRLRRWHLLAIVLTVLWLFVRGVPLDPRVILGELLLGAVVSIVVAWLLRRLFAGWANVGYGLRTLPYSIAYLVRFTWDLVVANVDVAVRVLKPSMPIEPAVIYVPLRVTRPAAISTIANSITLTPGTLTMDYDEAGNALFVHAIDGGDPEDVVAPIRRWEDLALVIFGEDADPDDPAPEIRVGGGSGGE